MVVSSGAGAGSRPGSALAAWRRGSRAARPSGRRAARARGPGRWRPAAAGRPRAGSACAREGSRGRARRRLADPLLISALPDLLRLEGEADVLGDGHVGVEGVVLEDHRDVAVLGCRSLTTRSPITISPRGELLRPAIIRSIVVLPQPDGPTTHELAVARSRGRPGRRPPLRPGRPSRHRGSRALPRLPPRSGLLRDQVAIPERTSLRGPLLTLEVDRDDPESARRSRAPTRSCRTATTRSSRAGPRRRSIASRAAAEMRSRKYSTRSGSWRPRRRPFRGGS